MVSRAIDEGVQNRFSANVWAKYGVTSNTAGKNVQLRDITLGTHVRLREQVDNLVGEELACDDGGGGHEVCCYYPYYV